jgi:hypothetical protein
MPADAGRKFNLVDGMILIAATALGLAGERIRAQHLAKIDSSLLESVTEVAIDYAVCVAFFWTLALPLLGLRHPRPPWRRLRRQPGMLVGVSFIVATVCNFVCHLLYLEFAYSGSFYEHVVSLAERASYPAPFALSTAVAWTTLAWSGRWRPESSWIDRLGRALGVFWIASAVFISLRHIWIDY